ncbi:S41 family peptidase [Lacinutrix salivirga]
MIRLKKYAILLVTFLVLTSCFEDRDDNAITTTEINDFVWKGLNTWYFWQAEEVQGEVNDLADDRFSSDAEYTAFLNSFNSPEALFDNLLFSEDRFSWIVDDYFALNNSLNGIFKTNGVEYGLVRINGGPELVGYVQYILPNTDASTKNITRGDLFLTVDGTQLTETNFSGLLRTGSDSYTLGMANLNNGTLETNGETIALTKQDYTENPVYITKTFEVDGIKVGYLMYNRFTADFDTQLNNAFAEFQGFGVQELVLDLRYNLGGSVNSAINLSSMITGQFTDQLLVTPTTNPKVENVFGARNFPATLSNQTSINSLNLNKVYVLAQGSSASASELVINSLAPYIDVIHIGETTRGKNEFSITLYDIPSCGYVTFFEDCNDVPNPSHNYAMQPLVGRYENAAGFSDFTDGLMPDIEFPEDIENLGVLGEQTEPLLARAIQHLTGNGRMAPPKTISPMDVLATSSDFKPLRDNMYVEPSF